ncbi:MAG: tetratricopeptide repeat-containing sensor histidine kinase [Pedobacter sp.]
MLIVAKHLKTLLLCYLFLFANVSLAQTTRIKSLETQLKQQIPDTTRLRLLGEISAAYTSVDPVIKFKYATKSKVLAIKLHDNEALADALVAIGVSYGIRGLGDSAILNMKLGYNVAKKINYLEGMGRALNNIGFAYDKMDDSRESIKYHFEALAIFKKLNFVKGINQSSINIGAIYYDLKQYKLAKSYYEQCYKSYMASKDTSGIGYSLLILGNCYTQLGDFTKAENYYTRSLAIKQLQGDSNGVALVHKGLGLLNTSKKEYPQALLHLKKAYNMVSAIQDKYEQAAVLLDLTDLYLATGDTRNAEKSALQALADCREIKAELGVSESMEKLVRVYQLKNDIPRAFRYQSAYIATKDSVLARKALKDITMVEYGRVRSENLDLTKDIESKGRQNIGNAATIKRYGYLIVLCLIIMIGAGLLILLQYRRNREKHLANQRLLQQAEEIAVINQELAQLNEIKTKFLAIISHDLRGPLANLQTMFEIYREGYLDEQEMSKLMTSLEDNVIATSDFLDTLLEWAKSQLEGLVINTVSFDVNTYFEENIRLWSGRIEHKKLNVKNNAQPQTLVLADPDMINMVIRNLLANSVKFCNPGDEITLNAQRTHDKTLISISDTGPGISLEQQAKLFNLTQTMSEGSQGEKGNHLGLILCRDTVLQNKGRMWFESTPNERTTFWVELPAG